MALALAGPLAAWTPTSQLKIAESAAGLAPPDLKRQIARHRKEYREGVLDAFRDTDSHSHFKDPGGRGTLDQAWVREVEGVIAAIESHQSFSRVVYRLGRMAHFLADANNPLNSSSADPMEPEYFSDFSHYLESAEPRVQTVFYGLRADLAQGPSLAPMIRETLERSRGLYPLVGMEYRRYEAIDGRRNFDDRSTAFGIASICYSHAVSDLTEALRYIWLRAGGADTRSYVPPRGNLRVLVPRTPLRALDR